MKDISLTPKYIRLVQGPCCCCVTAFQMILYRRGFGLFDQEELAKDLKIKMNKHDLEAYNIKLDTYTNPSDAGMKTIESEKIINQVLKKNNISLMATGVPISNIPNLKEFIIRNLSKNNDLWMEWMIYNVYDEKQHKKQWNMPTWMSCHDSVIESINVGQDTKVTVVDPFWYHKPRMEMDINKIKDALVGFIVIQKLC
ncbi:MAG: hypothetical protein KAI53_03130 [Candidatus Aenigmarchaeota archaeon]|nr:hypothetical protein [Candidatus Aenigmarchaeota archaeon]